MNRAVDMSQDERTLLSYVAAKFPTRWRSMIRQAWVSGDYSPLLLCGRDEQQLQAMRNIRGPSWLAMVKKIAVAANDIRWRDVVGDLSGRFDVHHVDRNKTNNQASNLTLELAELHRAHAGECFSGDCDF